MWSVASKTRVPSASACSSASCETLLEAQAVGHHEVGRVHRLEVLGRGRPVVRVDTVGHEDRHARPVADEVPHDGPQDRGGDHDVHAIVGRLGLGGGRSGLHHEQGEAGHGRPARRA